MPSYTVTWDETLSYSVTIEAENETEAWEQAYENSSFVDVWESETHYDTIQISEEGN